MYMIFIIFVVNKLAFGNLIFSSNFLMYYKKRMKGQN